MQHPLPQRREALRVSFGREILVTAIYVHTATRRNGNGTLDFSLLLRDVKLEATGKRLDDHVWLPLVPVWQRRKLIAGDYIRFAAVVNEYRKGYRGMGNRIGAGPRPCVDFGLVPTSGPELLARGW